MYNKKENMYDKKYYNKELQTIASAKWREKTHDEYNNYMKIYMKQKYDYKNYYDYSKISKTFRNILL